MTSFARESIPHRTSSTAIHRSFASSTVQQRGKDYPGHEKKNKQNKSSQKNAKSPSTSSGDSASSKSEHPDPDAENPTSFADIESRWSKIRQHYDEELKLFRSGGRFNPDIVGRVPVQPHKDSPETFPLSELAHIVPRSGRSISLLVHEREYVKPIISAVQASEMFNQQPQRNPDNESELIMKVEVERPEERLRRLKDLCHVWKERVRAVKTKRDKVISQWKKDSKILPDMKRKLEGDLEKITKKQLQDIDNLEAEMARVIQKDSRDFATS